MSGVDVLAVMDEMAGKIWRADDSDPLLNLADEARAAVADLIDAAYLLQMLATTSDEFPEWPDGWSWDRIESALSRVRGAE